MEKFSLSDMFSDTEGGTSSKRVVFFLLVITFIILIFGSVAVVWHIGIVPPAVIAFVNGCLDKIMDGIKWIGGFILADKTPAAVRAFTGNKPDNVSAAKIDVEPADVVGHT